MYTMVPCCNGMELSCFFELNASLCAEPQTQVEQYAALRTTIGPPHAYCTHFASAWHSCDQLVARAMPF